MKKKSLALAGALAMGLTLAVAQPANAATAVLFVPDDFIAAASDTRSTGALELVPTGLRISTTGSTSTDKVAEYFQTSTPLANVGEPTLNFTNTTAGGTPGYQLIVDFNNDGAPDGILVGEPGAYGDVWWLNNAAAPFVKDAAPTTGGGFGSNWFGTLDQWRTAFPGANVLAFGFSLGSGVKGDGVLTAINFGDTRYTFAEPIVQIVLESREACKKGGWQTSTAPVFKNQGGCVSFFARM